MKKTTIIGTGYVGLVTGACLAELGHFVTCLDIDQEKIASLLMGNLPFYEPGLDELVKRGVHAGRLSFSDQYSEAIPGSDICFLALPTPSNTDESCDLQFVFDAAKQIAQTMDNYVVIVNKSTVPVGTCESLRAQILKTLEERDVQIPFDFVSNPEFLREGTAIHDCMNPDRILLGVESKRASLVMKDLYSAYLNCIVEMDIRSAELAKYASNTMLAARISLMNDLSRLCEILGANVESVRTAMGGDPRIGKHYLQPGIGFGGSCLPKDVKALRSIAKNCNHDTHLLDSILKINDEQKQFFFEKILDYFVSLQGKTLAIWGVSFKPDTDDLREAPALYLIEKFVAAGASLRIFDPVAMPKAKLLFNSYQGIYFCEDEYEAALDADALILITEWRQFTFVDFEKIKERMKRKVLFDGRNQYQPKEMEKLGFDYFNIGMKQKKEFVHSL